MNRVVLKSISVKIFRSWKRLILIIVVLGVGFLIYRQVTKEPANITSTKVARGELVTDFTANGTIKARRYANLKFSNPGQIIWIGVKEGDEVKATDVLARLDQVALFTTYQQALNNLRNYQATADKVLDDVQGHATDENFTQRATRTSAEVGRDNAYQAVLAGKESLKNANLFTPISGTVTDLSDIVVGLNLNVADLESKIVRVVDLDTLYFEAGVDEVDYSKVRQGQEVIVNVDAYPDKNCKGKVTYVGRDGQKTSGGVITIPAEIELEDCPLEYVVGFNGQARFVLEKQENTLIIPKKYIVTKDGQDQVWLQVGNSIKKRKLVTVKLGKSSSTDAEITEGLSEGDTVIFIPQS